MKFVQAWPDGTKLCPQCEQPDNCGDCDHTPLTQEQVEDLGGWFVPLVPGENGIPAGYENAPELD